MGVRMVGCGESAEVHVRPVGPFDCRWEMRASVPAGVTGYEQRLLRSQVSCPRGSPPHSGTSCLTCSLFRGAQDGPGGDELTFRCGGDHRTPVSAIMTVGPLATVSPATSCDAADALAQERNVRHLLVTDGDHLLGIVCRCDLHPLPRFDEPVCAHMTTQLLGIDVDATLEDAASAIARLGIGCLPVFRRGELAGVVTRGDLRRAGVPEPLLGARQCCNCGSSHGVRRWAHGCDYCLECIDLLDALLGDEEFGEGD